MTRVPRLQRGYYGAIPRNDPLPLVEHALYYTNVTVLLLVVDYVCRLCIDLSSSLRLMGDQGIPNNKLSTLWKDWVSTMKSTHARESLWHTDNIPQRKMISSFPCIENCLGVVSSAFQHTFCKTHTHIHTSIWPTGNLTSRIYRGPRVMISKFVFLTCDRRHSTSNTTV